MLACVALTLASCSKSLKDYENATIVDTDSISGAVVFKTTEDLVGVADKDGKIILKPEFGSVMISSPFIEANLSDEKFNEENKKMVEKAGYKEGREYTREEQEKILERLSEQKHPYLVSGYGNNYSRLYNIDGKMLKDYTLQGDLLHLPGLGDSAIWKGGVPKEIELINRNGETTALEDYSFNPFGYRTKDGFTFVKHNGKWEEVWGVPAGRYNDFVVVKGTNSDPKQKTFSFFGPDGYVYLEGWDIVAWKEDKERGGIFIKIKEGEINRGEKRPYRSRPTSYKYISKEGKVQDLPAGYTVRPVSYDKNDADLYGPDGREIYTLYWHD